MSEQTTKSIEYTVDGEKYKEVFHYTSTGDGSEKFMSSKELYKEDTRVVEGAFTKDFYPFSEGDKGWDENIDDIRNSNGRNEAYRDVINEIAETKDGRENLSDVDKLKYADPANDGGGETFDEEVGGVSTDNDDPNAGKDDTETKNVFKPAAIYESGPFKDDLMYPKDMLNLNGQDYMFFEQFTYQPPQPSLNSDIGTFGKRTLTTGLGRGTNINEVMGTCLLPIPNRLSVSDGVNWGEGRANAVEAAAFGAATQNIGGVLSGEKSIGEVLKNATGSAAGAFTTIRKQMENIDGNASAATVLNAVLARGVLGSMGINVDIDQFLVRQTGQAVNPNLELLFGGPKLRSFSFDFNFAPSSDIEATEVRKIQRWFRQGMLAKKMSSEATALFLGSPNVFRLSYRNSGKRIRGLNTFKICALTGAQINFTPDGVYQSYEDKKARSMPVRTTMGLTFSELTPIFANDYTFVDEFDLQGDANPNHTKDTSLLDVKPLISGDNAFTKDDLGF